jgi:protein-S-isoprenylcysteine O-methyltransferase Ste14
VAAGGIADTPDPIGARAGHSGRVDPRWGAPIRIVLALALVAVGVVFLLVSMTVQTIAIVTGIGILLSGIAVLVTAGEGRAPDSGAMPQPRS